MHNLFRKKAKIEDRKQTSTKFKAQHNITSNKKTQNLYNEENREKKHGEKQKYMASIHKNRKSPDTMNVANIF